MITKPPDLTTYSKEDSSWGESLNNYMKMKHYTPEILDQYRFTRKNAFDWRMSTYNPITNKYTNDEIENQVQQMENDVNIKEMNRARDQQLKREATRDFLKDWEPKSKVLDQTLIKDYLEKKRHRNPNRPHATDECKTDLHSLFGAKTKLNQEMRNRTPYHIITLQEIPSKDIQSSPFETKSSRDKSAHEYIKTLSENSYRKYRQKHFDPVLQRFLNPSKEIDFIHSEKKKQITQETHREDKLPPFLKTSESHAYNIFTNQVKNPDLALKVDRIQNGDASLKKYVKGNKLIHQYIRKRNKEQDRQALLTEKRFKERSKKMNDSIHNGYDIIKNIPFTGLNSVKPPIPLIKLEKDSMWTTIKGDFKNELREKNILIRPNTSINRIESNENKSSFKSKPSYQVSTLQPNLEPLTNQQHSRKLATGTMRPRTAGFI